MNDKVIIDGVEYSYDNLNYPNPYYKTDHGLYNVPEAQFYDYLQREGTLIKDYWTGEQYRCFFRRNKDTNQTNDNISVYYPVNNGIHPGSLITHYGRTYLILNQESLENRVYHRSDGLNADIMLNTYDKNTHNEICVPCFAYDLTGVTPDKDDMMSVISGNVELMTGDNEMSRRLKVNQEFNAMGNWYTVVSVNFKTGIARIEASIIQSPSSPWEHALKINAEGQYKVGDAVKLTASATADNYPVENPTLIWTSSSPEIASVSAAGNDANVLFLSPGDCAISCYWKEHDITDTVYIKVVEELPLLCTIEGSDTLYAGTGSTKYTAKFYKEDGETEDTTISPVWSLDIPDKVKEYITVMSQSGNTISISAKRDAVGSNFGLSLTDADERYHATKTIRVSSFI